MKKEAKIISVILSIAMILSLLSALAVHSFAVEAPVFSVKEVSKKYNTVTVEVNLVSGSFNALDLNFTTSKGVKIKTISEGSAVKNAADALPMINVGANTAEGYSQVAIVSIQGYKVKGQLVVATFQVPYASDYSISIDVTDCRVTVGDDNVEVKPSVSSSVSFKYEKPTKTEPSNTTTKTTAKPTTKTTTKNNNTSKTNNNPSVAPTKNSVPTAVIPGNIVSKTAQNGASAGDTSSTLQNESTALSDLTDENLDVDEYSSESAENSESSSIAMAYPKAANKVQLKSSHNKKIIIIVAAAAAVLVAGAVVAIVIINKKKKDATNF